MKVTFWTGLIVGGLIAVSEGLLLLLASFQTSISSVMEVAGYVSLVMVQIVFISVGSFIIYSVYKIRQF
jgi:hypothetical protein